MEFWGMELLPKQAKPITCSENSYLHLTQAALGTNPKDGERVVLQIGFDKEKFVLGTLVKSTCDQMHLDLLVDRDFTLEHTGSTSVFVTGYVTAADLEEGQEFDDEEEEEDEDEDEDEEGDEEEEAAVVNATKSNGVPDRKLGKQAAAALAKVAKAAAKAEPIRVSGKVQVIRKSDAGDLEEDEDEDEDEDDEDDEDDEEGAVLRGAKEFDMDEDDDVSDEDDDEFADGLADEDDDDDDEEADFDDDDDEDDDEDDEEDDDMDEDEEGVENVQPPPKNGKRPAAEPKTPGTQKKAKVDAATPKTPAAAPSAKKTPGKDKTPAPAKTPKTPAASGSLGKYQCEPCKKNFTTETALSQHNSAKHK